MALVETVLGGGPARAILSGGSIDVAAAMPDAYGVPAERRSAAGRGTWDAFVAANQPNPEPPKASRGSMIYTSGTTGRPKGVRRRPATPEMQAKGNLVDHEYEIERDGDTVATVSKKWFRIRDTYGVEIAPGEDEALVLAITVCIDAMSHPRD